MAFWGNRRCVSYSGSERVTIVADRRLALAEPPTLGQLPSGLPGSENIAADSSEWQNARSASSLERAEVGGTHRPAEPRPRRPGAALLSDRRVTPSRPPPLRRNAGVTVQRLHRNVDAAAQLNAATPFQRVRSRQATVSLMKWLIAWDRQSGSVLAAPQ
jgi:hypothetical protein